MDADHEREFEAFVRRRSTALLRTAYLLTGDRGHAEDLLQSVLLNVARQWPEISGPAERYARRALANAAVDGWRRRRLVESSLEGTRSSTRELQRRTARQRSTCATSSYARCPPCPHSNGQSWSCGISRT